MRSPRSAPRTSPTRWTASPPATGAAPAARARVEYDGEEPQVGVNDVVIVRQGAGQVSAAVRVDGELFIRFAGDGLVIGTQLGSSAYTLAAGGPVLAPGGSGLVFTPLAPHGGCCPPLVAGPESRLEIELDPGHGARGSSWTARSATASSRSSRAR